ncbi:MAG: tetratricopeptide repeat protein [Polyangiaceae bacterium]|nr:tetratricopeptide repeat protein [Polyangiaceae bacterium]MCB9605193.1 tetratricopeptide repeat protein [Polyangiaceae bacterium]
MSPARWLVGAVGVFALGLTASPAHALDAAVAKGRAEAEIRAVNGSTSKIQAAIKKAKQIHGVSVAKRIAAGDLLLRTKDYERAIRELSKVLELGRQGKATPAEIADAEFLLADGYFQSNQLLSARRHYRDIIDHGTEPAYSAYAGRSLSRLVDVALRTDDLDSLDDVFARMSKLPNSDSTGSLQYARGKAYFAKRQFDQARSALATVASGSDYDHQSKYLTGAILVKEAAPEPPAQPAPDAVPEAGSAQPAEPAPRDRYAKAIEAFRKVTQLTPDSERHRHVIDLAWMAIGRLFYESDSYLDSAEAYSHVDRRSPEFTTMLYELAWVYVRLGDYQRAERALEVLAIADPKSLEFADGSLLRADLMLRSGKFEKALTLYNSVRNQFDPIREQVDRFLKTTTDPAVYYDKLVDEQTEVDGGGELPPLAIEWAREASEGDRVFSVIDDVSRSRELIRDSRKLATKLNVVLSSSTRAKAFPELKAGMEESLALLNRISLARGDLARGLEDVNDSALSGEIGSVRAKRRALMKRLGWLPKNEGDFAKREVSGEAQWNKVSQKLQQLTIAADGLQAVINGLKRVMKDADKHGVVQDPESRKRFEAEIAANERDLKLYRKRIKQYREAIEMGRAQIGFGDQRYVDDANVRREFRTLLTREVQLAAQGQAGSGSQSYAKSLLPVLASAERAEKSLEDAYAKLDKEVDEQTRGLQKKLADEVANVERYAEQLESLDQQARLLVGEVAMKNFGLVRDRLKNIVLRADTGIVQHAWEVREEARSRVINLQRERSREESNLNDELREVIDDAGDDE